MPTRVQMTRQRPWRDQHPDAVIVDRRTRWGNPFIIGQFGSLHRWEGWYVGERNWPEANHGQDATKVEAAARAVELYELHTGPMGNYELDLAEVRRELAGKDLACWCKPNQACHADVLLALAAGPVVSGAVHHPTEER